MEKLMHKRQSLKTSFIWMVLATVILITSFSLITIFACLNIRQSLVPNDDEMLLTARTITATGEITEEKIYTHADGNPNPQLLPENYESYTEYIIEPIHSPVRLSPKRQLLYNALPFAMIILPLLFTIFAIIICSLAFYQKKLKKPLLILRESAEKISSDNLAFTIASPSKDEMGMLCASFEQMRESLFESKQMIYQMMEERRQLNASIAHDLRTPITIIEGYTEYLQLNLPKGKIDQDKLMLTLSNLSQSSKRLQCYVDSIRDIQSLDEMELTLENVPLQDTINEMCFDLEVLTSCANKEFIHVIDLPNALVPLDRQAVYRILENLISNAIRYAKQEIKITCAKEDNSLLIVIQDDGPGFLETELNTNTTSWYKGVDSDGHMGLGLTISTILAKKHGGHIKLENNVLGGAKISLCLSIKP